MAASKADTGALLDQLYLELFSLIEQHVGSKMEFESHYNSGQMLLAKTRYIQGPQSVGLAQIPSELSANFNALCEVDEIPCEETVYGKTMRLIKNEIDSDSCYPDPLKWFCGLPSNSLRLASEQFKKCIELVVETANLQKELQTVMQSIIKIRQLISPNEYEE